MSVCNSCGELYVGETGDLLRMRVNKICTGNISQIVKMHHCQSVNTLVHVGEGRNKFSVLLFFKIPSNIHNPNFRKEKENYIIELLKPKLNVTPLN